MALHNVGMIIPGYKVGRVRNILKKDKIDFKEYQDFIGPDDVEKKLGIHTLIRNFAVSHATAELAYEIMATDFKKNLNPKLPEKEKWVRDQHRSVKPSVEPAMLIYRYFLHTSLASAKA